MKLGRISGGGWAPVLGLAGLLLLGSSGLFAQEKSLEELLALDLSDLLGLKVVSALKAPETIDRIPATVRVITADQIRANGYFTLEDALADLPGFQFRNIQGFNSYVFMRGVPSQNNAILLLVDGIQINELNSGGFYAGGQFNLANADRIEVVYGPASALYGTNAVSGIINIITRDPKNASGGRGDVLAGGFNTRLADFRYAAYDKTRDLGFSLSGMLKQNDKAYLAGASGDFNWTGGLENFENDAALDGRVVYKNFSAGFLWQDKNASSATARVGAGGGATPFSDQGVNWHIRFVNAWAAYAYEKKTWSIRSTLYYRNATVLDDTIYIIELPTKDSPGRQSRYYRPNSLIGDETRLLWSPGPRWRFAFGLVLEQERLAESFSISESSSAIERPPEPASPDMITNRLASAYAQVQASILECLEAFLGARHDDSSYYGAVDTPRMGIVYNRGKLTAKALYGEAFRAPRPWDFTDGMGNPDLRPEKHRSLEFAAGWTFSKNLRFDLAVYRNRLTNLFVRSSPGAAWRWINAGALNVTGCETAVEYRKGRLSAYANYTLAAAKDDGGDQAPEIAPHGANAGIQYEFSSELRVNLRGQYLGERKNPNIIPSTGNDRIAGALILHAALSLKLSRDFDLQLTANNLLDAEYYHPSNLPPPRYRQAQRSIRLQAGYSFR